MRVLHLTDPHLFSERSGELRGTVTYDSLTDVLTHYRASGWQADFVAMTGDLIQDDSAGAYGHFKQLLAELELPIHCVPGNHDIRALMRDAIDGPPFYYCDTVEVGNWLVVGIDSCETEHAGGAISAGEYRRLDEEMAASGAEHIMICLHHPPVPMGSKWLDSVGLDDGAGFLERIRADGRVRLAIFGHVHQPYDAQHDGIQIIGTPSTCRQFKPRSDDFAVDDRSPAYRRITLNPDGSFSHDLVWLDKN